MIDFMNNKQNIVKGKHNDDDLKEKMMSSKALERFFKSPLDQYVLDMRNHMHNLALELKNKSRTKNFPEGFDEFDYRRDLSELFEVGKDNSIVDKNSNHNCSQISTSIPKGYHNKSSVRSFNNSSILDSSFNPNRQIEKNINGLLSLNLSFRGNRYQNKIIKKSYNPLISLKRNL